MIRHVALNVRGALAWPKRELKGLLTDNDGRKLSPDQARSALMDMLSQGIELLPIGDCDGFDYKTGCAGHPAPEQTTQDAAQTVPEVSPTESAPNGALVTADA